MRKKLTSFLFVVSIMSSFSVHGINNDNAIDNLQKSLSTQEESILSTNETKSENDEQPDHFLNQEQSSSLIDAEDMKDLVNKDLSKLAILNLYNKNIDPSEIPTLIESLKQMPNLEFLSLESTNLTDDGVVELSKVFQNLPNLTDLHLDFNNIGNRGAATLAKNLPNLPSLNVLYLTGNKIGELFEKLIKSALAAKKVDIVI